MINCTFRPEGAEDLPPGASCSPLLRDDNWWHCRRSLQMLVYTSLIDEKQYRNFEQRLVMLLSTIEGGSTEAILWVIPLERVLKEISDACSAISNNSEAEKQIPGDVLRELISFVHAVGQQNLVSRCEFTREARNSNAPWNLQKWYTLLYQCQPRCQNHLRLRLLPHPREICGQICRDLFHVGTFDARAGSGRIRSFVSKNRLPIHNCIVVWLRDRIPHLTLICVFQWLGGLYHAQGAPCTSGSGRYKVQENFC
jgi:hypothetical protein